MREGKSTNPDSAERVYCLSISFPGRCLTNPLEDATVNDNVHSGHGVFEDSSGSAFGSDDSTVSGAVSRVK